MSSEGSHLDSGVFDIALDAAHHLDCNLLPVLGIVGLFFARNKATPLRGARREARGRGAGKGAGLAGLGTQATKRK